MQIRLVQSFAAAPLCFAALSLAAPSAHADPPRRTATVPAAQSRPRIALRPAPPPLPAPAPAVVAGAAIPALIAVEIREIRAGAPSKVERFSFPVTERGVSRIDSRVGDLEYRITVHRAGSGAASPLAFDIRKSERRENSQSESKVSASVRMKPGQPVVIATMDRADGSRTEVLAQLK